MTTPTPTPNQLPTVLGVGSLPAAAVEAAARALFAVENCDRRQMLDVESNWRGRLNDANREEYRILATAALTAAAPHIAAQAKAEAWDAVIARIDLGTPHMVDEKYVAGANWVRNQIEDVLKPTIEGKSE